MSNQSIRRALKASVLVVTASSALASASVSAPQQPPQAPPMVAAEPSPGAASAPTPATTPPSAAKPTPIPAPKRKGPLRASTAAATTAQVKPEPAPPGPPRPLGDILNAGIDSFYGAIKRRFGPDTPPVADRLNSALDAFGTHLRNIANPNAKPFGEHLQAQIDDLYASVGRMIPPVGSAVGQTLQILSLAGPVVRPGPVLTQADAQVDPEARLTLLQVWQAARVNDPALRAARAALAAGRERLPQARSQMLPQVQLSVTRSANRLQREGLNSISQPLTIFDRYPSANDTLSLRQPLLRVPQLVGIKQAQSFIQEAEAAFESEEQEFSVRVAAAYFEVLLAQDSVQTLDTQRVFLLAALSAARSGFERGVGTRTDIDAAQAKLDFNEAQGLEARQLLAQAHRQLQSFVSRPFAALAPVDPSKLSGLNPAEFSLDDWIQRAEENAPDIRRLRAQRESVRLELNKVRSAHLPTLDLIAQVQRSRSENTLSPSSQFQNNVVGLQLNVPIYSGGLVNSQTRQVGAELERIDELLRALREEVGVKVHREYRGVTEGLLRIRALEAAVRSADVAVDSARKSQMAGVRTAVDVLNAEQQRMQALRDLAQARYTMLVSMVKLQSLAGDTDEDLLSRVSAVLSP
jgi:outer membrane protein/protease secretion system outer membrane protein